MADKIDVSSPYRALLDLASASTKASKEVRDQIKVINSLSDSISTFGSQVRSLDNNFAKYSISVDKNIRVLNNIAALGLSSRGMFVFTNITSAIGALSKMMLEYDDARLKNFDELSKFGISTGMTTEKLSQVINQAGFWSTNSKGFINAVEKVGSGLINLGRTTAEGTNKLKEIINLDTAEEFMKLGIAPDQLASLQADYISMSEQSGISLIKQGADIRRSSYDYIKELSKLSTLTGLRIDDISKEIASGQVDKRLSARTQQLAQSGNEKAAKIFNVIAASSKKLFSPTISKGINDYLANGVTTTEEGSRLLQMTGGRISEYRQAVIDGRMSQTEFMRAVSKDISAFEQDNKQTLMYNDQWREQLGIDVETMKNARNMANSASDAELEQLQQNAIEVKNLRNDSTEGLKSLQGAQFRAEQKAGIARDQVMNLMSGPLNSAFRVFFNAVRSVSILMLKVSNYIGVGDGQKIKETIEMLEDETGYKGYIKGYKDQIKTIDEQIKLQEKDSAITKKAADDYKIAYEKQENLVKKMQKGEAVDPKELEAAKTTTTDKYRIFKEAEKAEKEKYKGKTGIQLEAERKNLQQSLSDREQREQARLKNQPVGTNVPMDESRPTDTLSNTQYIDTNLNKFSQLKPNFQQKIGGLAEKYYKLTGKKLRITSSYRTDAEQKELYKAWRDAGGRYAWESNPNPTVMTKFGLLSMPSEEPGQHGAGIAVDIMRDQLDFLDEKGLLDEFGLKRHRPIEQDPVHVVPKAKKGGVFGPGLIEMHGNEAKIPMKNKTIGIELTNAGVPNNFSNSMSNYTPSSTTPTTTPIIRSKSNDFINILAEKIDLMDRKIDESNRIFSDIKVYIRN